MNDILLKYSQTAKSHIDKANSLWNKISFINVAEVLKGEVDLRVLSKLVSDISNAAYSNKSEFRKYIDSLPENEYDLMYDEVIEVENLFYLVDDKFSAVDNIIDGLKDIVDKSEENEYLKIFNDVKPLNVQENMKKTNNVILESLMDKEAFEKIIFGVDFKTLSPEDRKKLISVVKKFHGEKLKTDKSGVWHTFVPVYGIENFISATSEFDPIQTGEFGEFSKFKKRTKELKAGSNPFDKNSTAPFGTIVSFYDYNKSETNPPIVQGYLKFVKPNRSLLKYANDIDYRWVNNSAIDDELFYHRDVEVGGVEKPKYSKVFFFADFDNATDAEKKELFGLIKKYGGITRHLSGAGKASGGQEYALIPSDSFEDFYHEASKFEPYEAETERPLEEEEGMINEVRRVVRKMIKEIFSK